MNPTDRVLAALEAAGCQVKPSGSGWQAYCPVHERDGNRHNRSLSISTGLDGKALLKCHAGCITDAILVALHLTPPDLFPPRDTQTRREVATYDYHDASGNVTFQVVRYEPKGFAQRRKVESGWAWDMKGVERVLYRLPAVLDTIQQGGTVYVVEGEKDADAINAIEGGHVATTNPGGAGKWRLEHSQTLKGAKVVIVQDKDEPGRKHAEAVAVGLEGVAASVEIREAKQGKDPYDHLAAGLGLAELVDPNPPFFTFDLGQVLTQEPEPIPWVIPGWLAERDICLLGGEPGTGKSILSLSLALALSTGKPWLSSLEVQAEPQPVLYVDEENSSRLARRRLRMLMLGAQLHPESAGTLPLRYMADNQIHFESERLFQQLVRYVEKFKPKWIILDSLVRFHSRNENDNSEMSRFFRDVLRPLAICHDCGMVLLHHLAKPSRERGSELSHRYRGASDILAFVDCAWGLEGDIKGNERSLTVSKSRWDSPPPSLVMAYEESDNGLMAWLVAKEGRVVARDEIMDALRNSMEIGCLRKDLVAIVESHGMNESTAGKTASRILGRLSHHATVLRRKEGKETRYWLAQFAPPSLTRDNEGQTRGTE